jgi:hypothetical protein
MPSPAVWRKAWAQGPAKLTDETQAPRSSAAAGRGSAWGWVSGRLELVPAREPGAAPE